MNNWEMLYRRYLKRRTEYVKNHNDKTAEMFRKNFLSEEHLRKFGMLEPSNSASGSIAVPSGCDEVLGYAKGVLAHCTDEIERYIYGLCADIIELCCNERYLPMKVSTGLSEELGIMYRMDFWYIHPKFELLHSRDVLYYIMKIVEIFREEYA